MTLKILIFICLLVAAILTFAALKPNTFHIHRAVIVNARPDKIFPLINDLHNWPRWAPQDRDDPAMQRSFAGAESGVGATSDWSGSGNTGKGRMTIIKSSAPTSVTINADWVRPFVARNVNTFTLEPNGSGTQVTWSMSGPNLFIMKIMSVFTNLDRRMGEHFEQGLQNLKAVAEQ